MRLDLKCYSEYLALPTKERDAILSTLPEHCLEPDVLFHIIMLLKRLRIKRQRIT